jgi:AAA15 family ATPase/GTPase
MLIEFRVKNFLSFKDVVTFSMVAASISGHEDNNVFPVNKLKLLKSSVLYGANASGKSNLLKAMGFMRWLVLNSSKEMQATEPIEVEHFRLSTETEKKPSLFEISFICDQKKYRYGFEIDKNRVHSEWLFFVPSRQEAKLFIRENNEITPGVKYFEEGKGLENKTRPNALFLSVVAQFNGEISTKILEWFRDFKNISGIDDKYYMGFTIDQLEDERFKKKFLKYLKIADFGINHVNVEKSKVKISELPERLKLILSGKALDIEELEEVSMSVVHPKYDKNSNPIFTEAFDLEDDESEGTKKFFGLLGPLIDTLNRGSVLIIDELDARLHPFITRFIIKLFNSKQTNPKNAQLIFATHDTNLLTNKLFRRDQIWFTERDKYGATDLYSLVEYKVRKDSSFEKDYIQGKYGAIPFIGNFEILLGEEHE